MNREAAFAAIDIGTTKTCALVAGLGKEGDLQVLGAGIAPSRGLRKGVVVNIDETVEAIHSAVERAERSSGIKVASAHIGVAGTHIASVNNRGVIAISRPDRLITDEDVARVIESARTLSVPSNREVIHVIPRSYLVDGQDGVSNPMGMHGLRLDVEAHVVTGSTTSIQNLTKCVERLGIEVDDLVLDPLASSTAVLTEEEKETGVVMADIGGGTTQIAIFIEGAVWHTSVLPAGGNNLTNDIAIGLRTPFASAEELKLRHGHAISATIGTDERVEMASFGQEAVRTVSRRDLAEVIQARVTEMLGMVQGEIKRSGYDGLLPAGLVVTGGTANLRGIEALGREVLELPVRVGVPRGIHGVADAVDNPAYATSVGLLLWGLRHSEVNYRAKKRQPGWLDVGRRLTFWVRELLPQ